MTEVSLPKSTTKKPRSIALDPTEPPRPELRRASGRADSQDRWQQILTVSADLFRRKGFVGTSMQDVSDVVGLLKGSLYYYIRSKEDLLFEILKGVHTDGEKIIASIEFDSADPLEELRVYLRRCIIFAGNNAQRLAIFLRDFSYLPAPRRREIISERKMYLSSVTRLIDEAKAKDMISSELDTRLAAAFVTSAISSTHEWLRPGGRRSLESAAEEIATLLINGLTLRNPEPPPAGKPAPPRAGKTPLPQRGPAVSTQQPVAATAKTRGRLASKTAPKPPRKSR
jgi:AcrR family transcriptional regulator